jgi:hypothetical protein
MRVGAQAVAIDFPTKIGELLFTYVPLKERPRIHSGGAVALIKNEVTGMTILGTPKKMVHSYVVEGGAGGEA